MSLLVRGKRWLLILWCQWQNEVWECSLAHFRQCWFGEPKPLINQPNWGIKGNKPECGNAREKGRDSPLRRGAIMSCAATAIYKMNGCQQLSWCVPRYAFQPCQETAEGPFWGGLSVSFQRSIPPFGPETSFGIWSGWDSPGLVTLSVGGTLSPSCFFMCYIQVNQSPHLVR